MEQETAAVLIITIGICFFWQSFLSDKIILQGDALNFFFMEKQLQANSLKKLELPLWNPIIYSGTPLLANSQAAFFYPTNIMLFFLPAEQASWLLLPISVIIAGISMFFFSRKIGLNIAPALVAAIAFMASGQIISRMLAGHLTLIATYSLIPLVFWCVENSLEKKSAKSFALLGIAITLQFFAGFMQLFYFTMLFAAAFGIFRVFTQKEKNKAKIAKGTIIALIVFLALSAAQLFPSIELSKQMTRSSGLAAEEQGSFSMPIAALVETIIPNIFGNPANHTFWGEPYYWEFTPFIGVSVLLLAAIAVFFNRKNKTVLFFFAVAIVSLLFALGKNIPLFAVSKEIISAFGMFRAPARMLTFFCFAGALLAGFGAQTILNADKKQSRQLLKICAIATALLLLSTAAVFFSESTLKEKAESFIEQKFTAEDAQQIEYLKSRVNEAILLLKSDALRASIALGILCAAIVLQQKNKHKGKAAALLCIAVFFELLLFSQVFLEPKTGKEIFEKNNQVTQLEMEKQSYRIVSGYFEFGVLPQYLSARFGIERADGYDPTVLKNYAELASLVDKKSDFFSEVSFNQQNELNLKLLGLLNVKYLIDNNSVKENPFFLPRAFVVGKAKAVKAGQAIEEIAKDSFDPKETVFLETTEKIESAQASFFKPAIVSESAPEKIEIKTDTGENGFLVVSVPFYPGWKATIDGKQAEIFKADHALMAIILPKGRHTVEMRFDPDSVKIGMAITLASIFLIASAALFYKTKKKNKKAR